MSSDSTPAPQPASRWSELHGGTGAGYAGRFEQWATWDSEPLGTDPSHVVSVHRR